MSRFIGLIFAKLTNSGVFVFKLSVYVTRVNISGTRFDFYAIKVLLLGIELIHWRFW
jgi:hypothetical protein